MPKNAEFLKVISDIDDLVAIMGNNEAECRSYLQGKSNLNLGSVDLSKDDVIKEIRQATSDAILVQLIDSCNDEKALIDLKTALKSTRATNDASSLLAVIQAPPFLCSAKTLVLPVGSKIDLSLIEKTIYDLVYKGQTPKKTQDELIKLANAANTKLFIDQFKNTFPTIDVSQLNKDDEKELNKWVLECVFAMRLSTYSSISAEAYPQLTEAFSILSEDKQHGILNRIQGMPALLRTTDSKEMCDFLSLDPNAVKPIFNEIQRVNQFKAINNAEIAKVLATIEDLEFKNAQSVETINTLLQQHRISLPYVTHPFDTVTTYEEMVEDIFKELKSPSITMDEFKTAFGIDITNQTLDQTSLIFTSIKQQHLQNSLLMEKYVSATSPQYDKALLDLLLTRKKEIAIMNGAPTQDVIFTETDLKEAQNIIDSWGSYDDFIKNLSTFMPNIQHEFTPLQFETMQKNRLEFLLSNSSLMPKKGMFNLQKSLSDVALDATKEALTRTQDNRKVITESMKPLLFVESVEPIHLICPAFRAQGTDPAKLKSSAQVVSRYEGMIKQCEVAIKSLEIDETDLDVRKQTLEAVINNSTQSISAAQIQKLQTQIAAIEEEKKSITDLKKGYANTIQAKLNNIINIFNEEPKTVATHLNNTKFNVYTDSNLHPRTSVVAPPAIGITPNSTQTNNPSQQPEVLKNLLIDAPKAGEVRKTEMIFTDPTTKSPTVIGAFKEEFKDVPVSQKVGGQLVTHPAKEVLLTVEEFPSDKNPTERIEFAMVMASQLLANADEPPGKNNKIRLTGASQDNFEALKYLWTAALILGKENPKMKFGPDDIEVPYFMKSWVAEQKDFSLKAYVPGIKNTANFSKGSMCKTDFCEPDGTYKAVVKTQIEGLNSVIGNKPTTAKVQSINEAAEKATNTSVTNQDLKEKLTKLRDRVKTSDENKNSNITNSP